MNTDQSVTLYVVRKVACMNGIATNVPARHIT